MSHPTITITEQPDTNCPQPVYNCVKYCFDATDYQTQKGTLAQFTAQINPALIGGGYVAGASVITIAGQEFAASTQNTYNEINTVGPQSKLQFSQNLLAACVANTYIFENFELEIVAEVLTGTARNVGEFQDFTFSHLDNIGNPISFPMQFTSVNGTPDIYRDNYRLIVEIYTCEGVVAVDKISQEAYIPQADGKFCINIGEKVAPLLETFFPFDKSLALPYHLDESIVKRVVLRYGESYSDDVNECNVQNKTFALTDCVRVINSAFQRTEMNERYSTMCEGHFMTNMPEFTELCKDSELYLWCNLFDIFVTPAPPDTFVYPYIEFFYTDGTSSNTIGPAFIESQDKVFAVNYSPALMLLLADPLKTVDYYNCRIVVRDTSLPIPTGDTYYNDKNVKIVSCCSAGDIEFYFINEFGAYDTILFRQLDKIDLEFQNAVFESFLDCEEESALYGGKEIIDINADDVYTVTSKFPNTYQSRRWLREFLTSPKKFAKFLVQESESEILSKVIIQNPSVSYFDNEDGFLLIRLSFILNESINLQKN